MGMLNTKILVDFDDEFNVCIRLMKKFSRQNQRPINATCDLSQLEKDLVGEGRLCVD